MYSKYQRIKILENCFQNMNCFFWIKLIPVLLHLKYCHDNSPYLEIPCLPHNLKLYPSQLKPLFNTVLIMLFIGFSISSYPVWPRATCHHNHMPNQIKQSWLFKNLFFFKVRQHSQQQLYLQYKVCWILCKMVDDPWFLQSYLCIQPPLQSPPKIRSFNSVNFYLPIPPLHVYKTILTIPTNTPFLYASTIFHLSVFANNHPNNLQHNHFPYLSYLSNSSCIKGPRS